MIEYDIHPDDKFGQLQEFDVAAFTAGHVFFPRFTRLATTALAAQAGADFLQFGYALAEQAAEG